MRRELLTRPRRLSDERRDHIEAALASGQLALRQEDRLRLAVEGDLQIANHSAEPATSGACVK